MTVEIKVDQLALAQLLRLEANAITRLADELDNDSFDRAVQMIYCCGGKVVLSGMGKAGIIAQKISATLASTGTPSHFLHPSEAVHGDLGCLRSEDIVIVLSNSGSCDEIVRLINVLKQLAIPMIAITGNNESTLAKHSDVTVSIGRIEEICPLGLAPTVSTTCMLALGDVLAMSVMTLRNFQREDYARYHPGGALGRKLIKVEQVAMFSRGKAIPKAPDTCKLREALILTDSNTDMRHGCILLTDEHGRLSGIFTDGDLHRLVRSEGLAFNDCTMSEIMTPDPIAVKPDTLASEAVAIFQKFRIDEIPVVDDNNRPIGLIDVQDIVALKLFCRYGEK